MFTMKESMLKWGAALGMLAVSAMFLACSDDDSDFAGDASGDDMGIVTKDIAGLAQKGPFVKGSAVTIRGIDCKTLELSDEIFEGEIESDKGDFAFDNVTLSSTCALFEVSGIYRSEITGKKSAGEITLHALTDLKDRKNVNINVLTELEYERLMYLVTEKGKKFADAKVRAEKEVFAAFGIAGDFDNSEDLTIYESGDGNAALLAVSVLMQAETDDAGLAKRIEKFADSFAKTGKWNDDKTKAAIEKWQVVATADGTLDSIRKNVEGWGYADVVPAFEKYIEVFGDTIILSSDSREGSSGSKKNSSSSRVVSISSSSLQNDKSSSSAKTASSSSTPRNDVSSSLSSILVPSSSWSEAIESSDSRDFYLNPEIKYDSIVDTRDGQVYKTVKIGDMVWMAENLNYVDSVKTPILKGRIWCYGDRPKDCETFGRLYSWFAAIDSVALATDKKNPIDCGYGEICDLPEKVQGLCPSGWHLPNRNEWNYLFEAIGGQAPLGGMVLKAKKSWKKLGYDTYGFSALAGGLRESGGQYLYEGTYGYFWSSTPFKIREAYGVFLGDHVDDVSLSNAGDRNMGFSVRCVQDYSWTLKVSSSSSLIQESSSSSVDPEGWNWTVSKEELFNPNIEYGTLIDPRDLQRYRTVTISLPEKNYSEVWMAENLNYDGPQTKGKSWCYNFEPDKCALGGRFYIWTAAIDSLALATDRDNPIVCSSDAKCGLNRMVQGVCPDGWHLPLKEEWERLVDALGKNDAGRQLKTLRGWDQNYEGTDLNNGVDAYGFSALPLGRMFSDGSFRFLGSEAYFWSSTENSYGEVYFMKLDNAHSNAPVGTHSKKFGRSVRCVKGEVVVPSSSNSGSSSSGTSDGWSWDVPKEKRFNLSIEYGSMIDPRDNRELKS